MGNAVEDRIDFGIGTDGKTDGGVGMVKGFEYEVEPPAQTCVVEIQSIASPDDEENQEDG